MTDEQLALARHTQTWENRLTFFWKLLIIFGVLTICATAGFVVYTLAEVQRVSQVNSRLNQRMIECTTPGYRCYDDGTARTGEAVHSLNEVTKAAVICADQPGVITQATMESCLKKQLGK
jgi:hypothetical protein